MSNLKLVFDIVFYILNTTLYFPPFSFTIWQFFVAVGLLSIVISAIIKVFG